MRWVLRLFPALQSSCEIQEEVEALRSAEQRRLDYSVSKGILQIWLATYALLGISVLLLCWWRLSVAVAYLCAMLVSWSGRFKLRSSDGKAYIFDRIWKKHEETHCKHCCFGGKHDVNACEMTSLTDPRRYGTLSCSSSETSGSSGQLAW